MSWISEMLGRKAKGARGSAGFIDAPVVSLNGRGGPRAVHTDPLPRFRATAGDQLHPTVSDKISRARLRLRNAYTPAQPVTDPEMFAGRRDILNTLVRAIEEERLHAIIYGERGIGKTSVLHVLMGMAREARYLVAYVSCGASAAFDETFRTIAGEIPLIYHDDYGPTSPEGEQKRTIADLLPDRPISPRLASDVCAHIVDTRVLVVLDEFDRAKSAEFRRNVGEFLKNLSDRSVRVQLVIAGVAANLEDLLEPGDMIQRNAIAVEMPKMNDGEVLQLVRNGQRTSGLEFGADAVDGIKMAANGFPYLASLLSQHAGLKALSAERMHVELKDVADAVGEAVMEIESRIPRRLRNTLAQAVREGSHRFLGPIAGAAHFSEGQFSIEDIASAFPNPADAAAAAAELKKLIAQGLLVKVGDDTGEDYTVRFLDRNGFLYLWLLNARAMLEAKLAAHAEPATEG